MIFALGLILSHVLLCLLQSFPCTVSVNILRSFTSHRQDGTTVIGDLAGTVSNNHFQFPTICTDDLHIALIDGNDHFLMVSQNLHTSILTGNRHRFCPSIKENTIRTHHF